MGVHGFTVYDMIARGASAHGDAPAIIQGERALSFAEFKDRVDALARGLAALGIGTGERVCILAQNDAAYLELYGACARQGIAAYPINWRLTAEEVERDGRGPGQIPQQVQGRRERTAGTSERARWNEEGHRRAVSRD